MKVTKSITKRLIAMICSFVMILAMALPTFAAPISYDIEITGEAAQGHSYVGYQVLSGEMQGNTLTSIQWGKGVNSAALLDALKADPKVGTYFTNANDATGFVAGMENINSDDKISDKELFLENVTAIIANNISGSGKTSQVSGGKILISGLDAGYYFVKDAVTQKPITRYILKLTDGQAVEVKGEVPTAEKKVEENTKYNKNEGYGQTFNDVADWTIGETFTMKLIGSIPKDIKYYDAYKYYFKDTLSTGLDLIPNSMKVYLSNAKDAADSAMKLLVANTDYKTSGFELNSKKFEVQFDDLNKVAGINNYDYIIVTYDAKLNANANIGLPGNENSLELEYSNNPNKGGEGSTTTTDKDKVIVFTYGVAGTKQDGRHPEDKLQGAEFVLLNKEQNKVATLANNKITGWKNTPATSDYNSWTTDTKITSGSGGLFTVQGLDDGTYYLKEIKAPTDYNLPEQPFKIVITATTMNNQMWFGEPSKALTAMSITADGKTGTLNNTTNNLEITINNNKGATLPETGGMGTTVFYIVGGILVVAAGVLLITKKRMGANR